MAKIYSLNNYQEKLHAAIDEQKIVFGETKGWDHAIRLLGFHSCQFIPVRDGGGNNSYWEMDDYEYTWFVLRFS